ncbi:NADH-quinone oxidoreductase subunit NuoH [Corynebacterium pyruviciproducens]|uniref:NADH-quinone oxidoreductase subunit H n=1 Tax=Corynebacterium pyruviciproducens TaxID=598660 RepID=A0AAF1BX71_9CORY|nr:NADH-quinone oxidoreductase subunit NuoH [Corynebacterium pyruviciproducens]WOT03127.1 NADH-quinone oxidoreductase subunit NuoH [Corynebacterium pyruviciproducens]
MIEREIGLWDDPWWLILIKAIIFFALPLLLAIVTVWYERRLLAFMQSRLGPNMAGPIGLLQPMSDGVKTIFKEDFMPSGVDKFVFTLAPFITGTAAFSIWSVLPIGGRVTIFGHETQLQNGDLPVAVLFILAIAGLGTYGLVLAGWSSTSRYSLLGGLRAAAQMISYEISMGLAVVAVVLVAGTMSTLGIVEAQSETLTLFGWESPFPAWNFLILMPAFMVYCVTMLAEANRAPFDMPECESELVGGYGTDYSGFRFAMFYLGEYMNMGTLSAICATLFLGGFHAPWPLNGTALDGGWWGFLWFVIKVALMLAFFIWVRATVPRYRYDQLMDVGWKTLLPLALGFLMVEAIYLKARQLSAPGSFLRDDAMLLAIVALYLVVGYVVLAVQRQNTERKLSTPYRVRNIAELDPTIFPLPELDGKKFGSDHGDYDAATLTTTARKKEMS